MKRLTLYFLPLVILSFLLSACGGSGDASLTDAELLKQKMTSLKSLESQIEALEAKIEAENPTEKKRKTIPVTLDSVRVKSFTEYVDIQGEIATKGDYLITAEQPGTLTSLNLREGQYVKKGTLVGTVDNSSIQSSIAELQLQLDLARDVFDRRKRLWDQKIGSEMEFLQAKNNVEALEKSIATAGTQLRKSQIYAPSNGVIESVNVKQGEIVSPGVPIATLIDVSNVQIVADVSESYLSSVSVGDELEVNIPALEIDTKAWISNIGSIINPANRTFRIEARVSNKGGKLKPNLLTMLKIKKFEKNDAIVVPTGVLQREGSTDFVYVLGKEKDTDVAFKKAVKVERSAGGETIIASGLSGVELLIDEGKTLVKNGSAVTIR